MTKEQLVHIAQVGFPERVKQLIEWDKVDIHSMSGVYRLYNTDKYFNNLLPKEVYLSIHLEGQFVQIQTEHKAFDHYAAIKEMEAMGLIPTSSSKSQTYTIGDTPSEDTLFLRPTTEIETQGVTKPPLGLMPKKFHNEQVKANRLNEVCQAIARYYNIGRKIPIEWVEEYNELVDLKSEECVVESGDAKYIARDKVIRAFRELGDAIIDKGCCGNAQLIGTLVWKYLDEFTNTK